MKFFISPKLSLPVMVEESLAMMRDMAYKINEIIIILLFCLIVLLGVRKDVDESGAEKKHSSWWLILKRNYALFFLSGP